MICVMFLYSNLIINIWNKVFRFEINVIFLRLFKELQFKEIVRFGNPDESP
jgi:hypothetical protein